MIYLLTRPFAWAFALLVFIVTLPARLVTSIRDHRDRKRTKYTAKTLKAQAKQAKKAG
jgi:hypothetical protein